MIGKLTKRTVESIAPGARDVFMWDTELPGFGLKITPRGARIYVLQYKAGRRSKRCTIGRHGVDKTAEEARIAARVLRGQIARGDDPAAARAAERAMPTVRELARRYETEYAAVKKKASSAAEDKRNLVNHVLPALGRIRVDQVTRADIERFHGNLHQRPGAANRCLALLSKMFNLAEKWEIRPDGTNPTRHVDKYPETKVERFLSGDELARLGKALKQAPAAGENIYAVAGILLLLLTGCRRGEILSLQWEHVDFEHGALRLADSKTGQKYLPLGKPAIKLLKGLPRVEKNPYVLPGREKGAHLVNISKPWRRIRAQAELTDVRLHDLRHAFASVGAAQGESLPIIGALLGHRSTVTTSRYAHLSDDHPRAAADRISGEIAKALRRAPVKAGSRANSTQDSPSG